MVHEDTNTGVVTPRPAMVRLARRGLQTYPISMTNEQAPVDAADMVIAVVAGLSGDDQDRLTALNGRRDQPIAKLTEQTPTIAQLFEVLDMVDAVIAAAGDES